MINKQIIKYCVFGIVAIIFCFTENIFANLEVKMSLGILPPAHQVEYNPSKIIWQNISWAVYVNITGNGIKTNTSWIRENGIHTFEFYRWTWPFTTWAWFSESNKRTLLKTTTIIDWIDNILPTFVWAIEWANYTTPITIAFADNNPWVSATLNGTQFINWSSISNSWNYQFIVIDAVGNWTWVTFTISLDNTDIPSLWGGSRWGSRRIPILTKPIPTKSFCKNRSCYSSYYDYICGPCTPPIDPKDQAIPPFNYTTPKSPTIFWSIYPKERNDAYQRAYKLWITTIPNIKDADLDWLVYRKIVAKMVSEFAIKIVWLSPDETKDCKFKDIKKEDPELKYYMELSCKLGIMWLDSYGNPDTVFNPNHFVTRDQFVTILSRTLFRGKYNLYPEEFSFFDKAKNFAIHTINNITNALKLNLQIDTQIDWYTKHLEIIKQLWVITNDKINIKELKIYIMLIMHRIDLKWIDYVKSLW